MMMDKYKVLYDFIAEDTNELTVKKDMIVIAMDSPKVVDDWLLIKVDNDNSGRIGYVPVSYLQSMTTLNELLHYDPDNTNRNMDTINNTNTSHDDSIHFKQFIYEDTLHNDLAPEFEIDNTDTNNFLTNSNNDTNTNTSSIIKSYTSPNKEFINNDVTISSSSSNSNINAMIRSIEEYIDEYEIKKRDSNHELKNLIVTKANESIVNYNMMIETISSLENAMAKELRDITM